MLLLGNFTKLPSLSVGKLGPETPTHVSLFLLSHAAIINFLKFVNMLYLRPSYKNVLSLNRREYKRFYLLGLADYEGSAHPNTFDILNNIVIDLLHKFRPIVISECC